MVVVQTSPDRPDLTGLRRHYRWTTSRRLRIVLLVVTTSQAVLAVVRMASSPDTVDVALSGVQLLAFAFFLCAYFGWTPGTDLSPDDVRVRNGFPGARAVPWADVEGVQVQNAWQDTSVLVLRDGRTRRLIGVPVDDARRLAEALAARRPG